MPLINRSAAEWYTHTHAGQQEGKTNQMIICVSTTWRAVLALLLRYISNSKQYFSTNLHTSESLWLMQNGVGSDSSKCFFWWNVSVSLDPFIPVHMLMLRYRNTNPPDTQELCHYFIFLAFWCLYIKNKEIKRLKKKTYFYLKKCPWGDKWWASLGRWAKL